MVCALTANLYATGTLSPTSGVSLESHARFRRYYFDCKTRQGLLKINVGDHARFIISPDLCYGSKGFYPLIPANAALIVQIELLEAEPSNPNATLGATLQDKKTHEHVF
jgi:hypothetical protein